MFICTCIFRPFMLYIAPHDSHRCDPYNGKLGNFCEKFGDGTTPGTGVIPDWKPTVYGPSDVEVPYFLPDTPATRGDLAALYKTYSRLDQGMFENLTSYFVIIIGAETIGISPALV